MLYSMFTTNQESFRDTVCASCTSSPVYKMTISKFSVYTAPISTGGEHRGSRMGLAVLFF